MRHARTLLLCLSVAAASCLEAQTTVEQDVFRVSFAVLTVGGGVVSAISGLVFAAQERSYPSAWLVVATMSASGSAAVGVAALQEGDPVAVGLGLGLLALAAWPAYWAIRSGLAAGPLGGPLDAPAAPVGAGPPLFGFRF